MTMQKTLLAAAVLFALAACQTEPTGNHANAAQPLAQEEPPPDEDGDGDDGDENGDEDDPDDEDSDEGDDGEGEDEDDIASSPADVTEHADAAATDALLDTREGGNPLAEYPLPPVDPIAEQDEDEEDEDEDKR